MAQGITVPGWLLGLLPGQVTAPPADPLAPLELTDGQTRRIALLAAERARQAAENARKTAMLKASIPALYVTDPIDEQAIVDAWNETFDLQREIAASGLRTYNAQIEVLDEHQRDRWRTLRQLPGASAPGSA
jgi:hypothetical protein